MTSAPKLYGLWRNAFHNKFFTKTELHRVTSDQNGILPIVGGTLDDGKVKR